MSHTKEGSHQLACTITTHHTRILPGRTPSLLSILCAASGTSRSCSLPPNPLNTARTKVAIAPGHGARVLASHPR